MLHCVYCSHLLHANFCPFSNTWLHVFQHSTSQAGACKRQTVFILQILVSIQIVKPSFMAGWGSCYYRFDKLTPPELEREKKKVDTFIIKDVVDISTQQIYELTQKAAAEITEEDSLWFGWKNWKWLFWMAEMERDVDRGAGTHTDALTGLEQDTSGRILNVGQFSVLVINHNYTLFPHFNRLHDD